MKMGRGVVAAYRGAGERWVELEERFPAGTEVRDLAVDAEEKIGRALKSGAALEAYPGDWEPDGDGPVLTCPTHLRPIGECLPCLLAGEEQRL